MSQQRAPGPAKNDDGGNETMMKMDKEQAEKLIKKFMDGSTTMVRTGTA